MPSDRASVGGIHRLQPRLRLGGDPFGVVCHIFEANIPRFARFARNVWGVQTKDDVQAARDGIEALAAFIREIGLPTTLPNWASSETPTYERLRIPPTSPPGAAKS